MQITTVLPAYPLNQCIDIFWHCTAANFINRNITLPLLHQELVINFSDQFYTQTHDGTIKLKDQSNWLMGLQTGQLWTETTGYHESLGILFKPHGLFQLFGISALDLSKRSLCLQDLFGEDSNALLQELQTKLNPNQKLALVQAFMLQKARMRPIKNTVANLFSFLQEEPLQRGKLKQFMREQETVSKTFIANFKTVYGTTPKKLIHLRQINEALQSIAATPTASLTSVALNHGFYDQAHFTRIFQTYTGLQPKQYRQLVMQGRISQHSPNNFAVE